MSDHSLPEEILTTLEPAEMALIATVCRYQSLLILLAYTEICSKICLGVAGSDGQRKEHYRDNEDSGMEPFFFFFPLAI